VTSEDHGQTSLQADERASSERGSQYDLPVRDSTKSDVDYQPAGDSPVCEPLKRLFNRYPVTSANLADRRVQTRDLENLPKWHLMAEQLISTDSS
jgi:hypothetical protein